MNEARGERIAKWLARAGVASRRDAEKMIEEGRVRLNGRTLTARARADHNQIIKRGLA